MVDIQQVSAAWKENQQQNFVSESFVDINFEITDPYIRGNISVSDNGEEYFSDSASLISDVENTPHRYATGETNIWILNGTADIIPDNYKSNNEGYISNWLCDSNTVFEPIPTITLSFKKVFQTLIPGITIEWGTAYNEWAESFRLTIYNGETVVMSKTVENNTDVVSFTEMDIINYNKITVEVLRWSLPNRRARIKRIVVGLEKKYSKSDIMSYSHSMDVNPLSAELPKTEVIFAVSNVDGQYNPDNPQGVEKYLMERQELTVKYGYKIGEDIEYIDAGRFYLSNWDTPQNGIEVTFTGRDILELMTDKYSGTLTGNLYDIALTVFNQMNLPLLPNGSKSWSISETLKTIQLPENVSIDEQTTIAEVLQYVANAGCCVLYQDRYGILHIEPLAEGVTDYRIDRFNSYEDSEIELTKQLKAVDVNNGQYILNVSETGETQSISNPFISDVQAPIVAQWVANYLQNRRTLSGNFRADPRLDALDRITNQNRFSENTALVTSIKYTYNGAFRGSYEGRTGA